MIPVPETRAPAPGPVETVVTEVIPSHLRRVVAVAVSPMELLRPESDLARLVDSFAHVDLLLAADDRPAVAPGPLGVLGGSGEGAVDPIGPCAAPGPARDRAGDGDDGDDASDVEEFHVGVARLGLSGLRMHRLGLPAPLGPRAEDDLVAAMSELVGFDPEQDVYCLAPAPAPADPSRVVIDRAVQRVAQVYGLPLLRYRCLELSVVADDLT